jgi:hypothetical protein
MMHRAQQLSKTIASLDRRIDKLDALVTVLHGGRKCGRTFWCGGYCDRVKEMVWIMEEKEEELGHALALMAAEKLAVQGLCDDVLQMIVGYAKKCPDSDDEE